MRISQDNMSLVCTPGSPPPSVRSPYNSFFQAGAENKHPRFPSKAVFRFLQRRDLIETIRYIIYRLQLQLNAGYSVLARNSYDSGVAHEQMCSTKKDEKRTFFETL